MPGSRPQAHKRHIQVESITEKVAEALREMIVSGELAQDAAVTQSTIAEMLNVSTMPVREALLALSHEGMIVARRNRGFQVARMNRRDVEDIYWVHGTLAGELTARACAMADQGMLNRLVAINGDMDDSIDRGDIAAVEDFNWNFHREINSAADSPHLINVLRTTLKRIPRKFYTGLDEWSELSRRDHRRILSALLARDPEEARLAAAEHVREAGELFVASLDGRGYWKTSQHDPIVKSSRA